MWTIVFIVVLSMGVVIAPVMMVRPTKRQAKIARLRAFANEKGLYVRTATGENKPYGSEIAIYGIPWPEAVIELHRNTLTWCLERAQIQHDIHFQGEWDWVDNKIALEASHELLRDALQRLPDGVFRLTSHSAGIECYWDETLQGLSEEASIDALKTILEDLVRNYQKLL